MQIGAVYARGSHPVNSDSPWEDPTIRPLGVYRPAIVLEPAKQGEVLVLIARRHPEASTLGNALTQATIEDALAWVEEHREAYLEARNKVGLGVEGFAKPEGWNVYRFSTSSIRMPWEDYVVEQKNRVALERIERKKRDEEFEARAKMQKRAIAELRKLGIASRSFGTRSVSIDTEELDRLLKLAVPPAPPVTTPEQIATIRDLGLDGVRVSKYTDPHDGSVVCTVITDDTDVLVYTVYADGVAARESLNGFGLGWMAEYLDQKRMTWVEVAE